MDPHFSSFNRFQCILLDSGVLFTESWNFYKLNSGDLISAGNQFCRKSQLFGPRFSISILKVLLTKIFHHSLDFNAFCMIQEYYSQSLQISADQRGEIQFLGGTSFAEYLNYLVPLLYFNFKSFLDPNSSSFVRFQWILLDSGVLISESWNFYKIKREGGLFSGASQFCRKSKLFGPPFCISILKFSMS